MREPPRGRRRSPWAAVGLIALPLLCCGFPALAVAGTLAVAGGWLAAHGLWLGGGGLLVVATILARRWWTTRPVKACDVLEEL